MCFRAIRKWEPYGGSLASVGRTTYPKGRMYIPFSRNKWVQSKHLLYFDTLIFCPMSSLFILFHPVLMIVGRGCGVKCLPHQVWVRLFPFWNARTGLSPPGDPFLKNEFCSKRRINGSSYSLIPPCVMIPASFSTKRSQDWWRALCSRSWSSPFRAPNDPPPGFIIC